MRNAGIKPEVLSHSPLGGPPGPGRAGGYSAWQTDTVAGQPARPGLSPACGSAASLSHGGSLSASGHGARASPPETLRLPQPAPRRRLADGYRDCTGGDPDRRSAAAVTVDRVGLSAYVDSEA